LRVNSKRKEPIMALMIKDSHSKFEHQTFVMAVPTAATLAIQGSVGKVTFTADTAGVGGNSITVAFTGGATAGAEVVTVVGNAISVQIQTGVTTAAQVKTAVDAKAEAQALVNTAVTTGGAVEVATAAALSGGTDGTPIGISRVGVGMFDITVEKGREIEMFSSAVHTHDASTVSNIAKVEVLNFDASPNATTVRIALIGYDGVKVDVTAASSILVSMILRLGV
jgi:hypothetical protein